MKSVQKINETTQDRILEMDLSAELKHGVVVSNLAYDVAKELGLGEEECYQLAIAGMLHDIGKLKLEGYINGQEQNPMVIEELKYVRMHSTLGYELLKDQGYSDYVLESILYHHENFDGSGYPSNKSGREIPMGARILRVCDVYAALSMDRPYRKALENDEVLKLMIDEIKNFDMQVFLAFQRVIHKGGNFAKVDKKSQGVAIAYDSRHMSPEFAQEAALCLAANGIKAYIFETLRPTPELSFAVRHLGCVAGINVTASHNPPEYNGYKVYWEDGAQITPPHDSGIMGEVKAISDWNTVKTMDKEEAVKAGLFEVIGQAVDDAYMAELKKQIIHMDAIEAEGKNLKIVYTPLHGTGNV